MSSAAETAVDVRPFQVSVPEEQLAELRRRIEATRWPTRELVADRSQGVQLATLQALARYWTTDHDWRKAEAKLNALPQFTTEIDGVEIHFIHVRSRHENALPLIMTHGWPGSVIELLETVGPLTDPTAHGGTAEDAFHLVLPSLPGYGFSSEPTELGWDAARTGRAWAELMHRLGYTRYVAQGGDVGALVTDLMGRQAVEGLAGYHLNLLTAVLAVGDQLPKESEQERAAAARGRGVQARRLRLLPGDGNAATDDQLRPAGFTRRAGRLAARPRHGQLLQDLPRLRRRRARGQSHPGEHRRQHHAVLADRHRSVGGPVVLGGRTSAGRSACERPAPSGGHGAGRLHDVPRRDLGLPAQLGRGGLPRPRLLQRGRQGRPFRRLGGAAALRHRDAGCVQLTAPMTPLFGARRHPRTAALPVEGHLPGFDGATGWLNSSPLTPAELRGRVVLVNFWTYTCINWLRTLAYVRAWSEKYRDRGLVVIGVHTPEFPFEREVENVREAARAMRVEYPVALDSDYGVWSAFANRYWPAVYLADAEGRIRYHHFGEGEYDDGEWMIQHLLREAEGEGIDEELVSVTAEGLEAQADWTNLGSPETYLGYQQGQNLDSPGGAAYDEPRSYVAPESLQLNTWALGGNWTIEERASVLERSRGANRLPLPCARRPSRAAFAGWHGRSVPRVGRRRSARRGARAGRRRGGPRNAGPATALSVGARDRVDHGPHVRDRIPRCRRGGVRLHLRLATGSAFSGFRLPLLSTSPQRVASRTHSGGVGQLRHSRRVKALSRCRGGPATGSGTRGNRRLRPLQRRGPATPAR